MSKYIETKVGKYIIRKYNNGSESWWLNERLHREDGPAVKYADGTEVWYKNGKFHREDGPQLKKLMDMRLGIRMESIIEKMVQQLSMLMTLINILSMTFLYLKNTIN